jgi:hypothetical protein
MTITQEYNVDNLIEQFEQRWNQTFKPDDKVSQACLFEELVFGQHINPEHAQAIVKQAVAERSTALRA